MHVLQLVELMENLTCFMLLNVTVSSKFII